MIEPNINATRKGVNARRAEDFRCAGGAVELIPIFLRGIKLGQEKLD